MRVDNLSVVVAELESGKRPKGGASENSGNIPSLGGEHLNKDGGFAFENLKYIDAEFFGSLKKGMIKQNDILIVKDGATTGKVSFVSTNFPFKRAAINEHLFALRVNTEKADPKYVFLFLRSPKGQKQILKDFRGAAIGGISRGFVELAKIPLPPLDDQKRIAHLLGKMEGLITRRKRHLQQLDDLLKSVFQDMFGDSLRNESGYGSITKACDFIDYRGKTPPRTEAGIPLISAKCVRRGYFDAKRLDYVSDKTFKKIMTRGFPKANDVLFTTEGATFGYTCRIPRYFQKFAVGQRLITLVCKEGFQPEVLEFVLNDKHIQKKLNSRLSGSAALGIRSAQLTKVAIPFPSPVLQAKFAGIVEKVETLKSHYQQSLTDLESLYGALSQKAFKGELDLSRVSLPVETTVEIPYESVQTIATETVFELPKPIELAALKTPDGRKALMDEWLNAWLENLGDAPFASQEFMEAARQRQWEQAEDDSPEWGLAEYDYIKSWVFEQIQLGKLKQTRNTIYVNGKPKFGNQVILRTRIPKF